MKSHIVLCCGLVGIIVIAIGQGFCSAQISDARAVEVPENTAPYKNGMGLLMIDECRLYAQLLKLPESLPFTISSVKERFVTSPHVANQFGALGSIRTERYSYGFGKGKHLTYITRLPRDESGRSLYERFKPWAIKESAVNTNAAYKLATQWLNKVFVDLACLSKGSTVSIIPEKVQDMTTSIYDIMWRREDKIVAQITLEEKSAELWSLRIEDPSCILRSPLTFNATNGIPAEQSQ